MTARDLRQGSSLHLVCRSPPRRAPVLARLSELKLIAVFDYESAEGLPSTTAGPLPPGLQPYQGGAPPWGPLQIAPPSSGENNHSEFESIGLFLAWAM